MANQLINGIYPVDYLFLRGVDQITHPEEFWWASRERLAPAEEFLELDYGRVRQVNYLKFSVIRAPIDIDIFYDSISDDDGTHKWVKVTRVGNEPFSDSIHYSPAHRNMWHDAEFYFTDRQGNAINTRFIRIGFTRRDEAWPHSGANPFRWSITVKNLRSSRFINTYSDTLGTLFDSGAANDDPGLRTFMGITQAQYDDPQTFTSDWVEQTLNFGTDVARGGTLWPNILGFSVLGYVEPQGDGPQPPTLNPDDVRLEWQFEVDDVVVQRGITKGSVNLGRTWINVYFDPSVRIPSNHTSIYKIRVRSQSVHDQQGNALFGKMILDGGTMFFRLWGDVADTGRDVLGNFYRYGTRIDEAAHATELSVAGWMSEPSPSPSAVEALYFDTRYQDDAGTYSPAVIDAIKIAPRTPGVEMHIYYTAQHLQSDTPQNAEQYDHLLWTPVQSTFKLTGSQRTIELPGPIKAAFVKLEFTKLQPRAFTVPTKPDLPTQTYKRYPTWIEQQYRDKKLRQAVNQYFLQAEQRKEVNIPYFKSLSDPILEFQYKERLFLAALASNEKIRFTKANSDIINRKTNVFLDPITMSRIHVQTPTKYQGPLTLQVDVESVLGQIVADSQDTTLRTTLREGGFEVQKAVNPNPIGQTITESFSHLADTPMWFNRVCRHIYAKDEAKFGRVAYFAGIDFVQFLRKDYTVVRDDDLISEGFHDLAMLNDTDWIADNPSKLYAAVADAVAAYDLVVDYTINGTKIVGEQFALVGVDDSYTFASPGLTQASDVHVYQDLTPQASPTRGYEYQIAQDYDLAMVTVESGINAGQIATVLTLDVQHERIITQVS